uniref:G-protein coupled receptors family 1 profile domain-containing protein n=1 Tax=Romanomermis culicivorax TaxID=13658 RepID=A0A915I1J8_ROMCU
MLVSGSTMPASIGGLLLGKHQTESNRVVCTITAFLCAPSCIASLYSIVWIAVSRYYYVTKYSIYMKIFTRPLTLVYVTLIWLLALMVHLPNYYGWGQIHYSKKGKEKMDKEGSNTSMSSLQNETKMIRATFKIFVLFFICWAPLTILFFLRFLYPIPLWAYLYATMLAHAHELSKNQKNENVHVPESKLPLEFSHHESKKIEQADVIALDGVIIEIYDAAMDFGKGQIQSANIEKEIISGMLFDNAQIPPRLSIPSNPMVLDAVYTKGNKEKEGKPYLESDDSEDRVMRITKFEEDETFIWTKTRTYIPLNTFVQAVVWPQKDWAKGPIVVEESGKDTPFDIDASIFDARNNNFRIMLINGTNKGISLHNNELIVKSK